ncbi:MAG: alpha/beta hydrolase [Bryobacterales bacterium]|nr:alpha/beta hydrolase [Bryobacterales bacterium]
MAKFIGRVCLWGGSALVVVLLCGTLLQWSLSNGTARRLAAPGMKIDVGGHRLHLRCQGSGTPTVVFEAGLPGSSLAWASVSGEVASFTTTCSYDRAGYAWSEPSPAARSAGNIVRELHLLLRNSGIAAPFVLVGHSFGGLLMQLYASQYPDDVAGMVLVDSSHSGLAHQSIDLDRIATIGRTVGILAPTGIPRFLFPLPAGDPASREDSVRAAETALMKTTKSVRTAAAEMAALRTSLQEVAASPLSLGNKPLYVLSEGRRRAEFWLELQEDLTGLSTASEWRIAERSGHFIHHDQPELVIEAVRTVVRRSRSDETVVSGTIP